LLLLSTKPQKTQQKRLSSLQISNSMKTKQIKSMKSAYEFPSILYT
jgi:hypothetical protein